MRTYTVTGMSCAACAARVEKTVRAVPGNGLSAVAAGRQLAGGNRTFISGQAPVPPLLATKAEALAAEGKTPLYFSRDGTVLGCIAVADTLMDAAGREARPALCATLRIAGMMCPHCEARVKTALEAVEGVLSAAPSHERGEAVVELADDVPEDAFRRAVEDAGYQWQGVR